MPRTKNNVRSLVLQSLIAIVAQFLVYRLLIVYGGAGQMGIWAVILAVTGFMGIAGSGAGNALTKELAETGTSDIERSNRIIASAIWLTGGLTLVLALLLYFGGLYYIRLTLDGLYNSEIHQVFLLAGISVMINSFTSVFIAVFDARHQFTIRSLIISAGYILFALSACFLIRPYGLKGIAWSMCFQWLFVLIAMIVSVNKRGYFSPLYWFSPNKKDIKRLFRYGTSIQLINLIMMFFDPVSKFFINNRIDIQSVGYYEMANRLVIQLRNLLSSTSQVLLPKVAAAKETGQQAMFTFAEKFHVQNLNFALCAAFVLSAASWLISYFLLGEFNTEFMIALLLLNIGWMFNIFSAPAYFYFLGKGDLLPNITQHLIFAFTTAVIFLGFTESTICKPPCIIEYLLQAFSFLHFK